jgi:hypothetical protein
MFRFHASLFRASVPYAPLMLWKIKGGVPATVVLSTDFLKGFLATGVPFAIGTLDLFNGIGYPM